MKKSRIGDSFLSLTISDAEEFDITWIPEGAEEDGDRMVEIDLPANTVDRICKKKYGHTNWARMSAISPEELQKNPADIDYEEGIVYFKKETLV